MRFIDAVIVITLLCFLQLSVVGFFTNFMKLEEKALEIRRLASSQKFVAESFRNTCEEKGFVSLNEWQVTCRAMFNLEYIGWSDAEDFMEVSYENSTCRLLYGKWNGVTCSGEIYCRKK